MIFWALLCSLAQGESKTELKPSVAAVPTPRPTVVLKPMLAVTLFKKGQELVQKKLYDQAITRFSEAIKADNTNVSAYIEWSRTAVLLKRRKEALERLEQALRVATKKEDRQRIADERSALSEIFFTNETFQRYQNGLNSLQMDRVSVAIDQFEQAMQSEGDNVAILTSYADALARDKNSSGAIKAYEQALLMNPEKRLARLGLAETLLESQPKRGQQLIEAIALETDAPERAALLYAKILASLGKEKESLEYLRYRTEQNGAWVESLLWLGRNYARSEATTWLARKYLMMFLKREREHPSTEANRKEAQELLTRVNDLLK